jgi:transposase
MGHVSVLTGPERRRRWSEEQKFELLTAAFGAGGNVAEVARRADICTSLLYRWRQTLMRTRPEPAFVPAVIAEEGEARRATLSTSPVIVVELGGGARVSIGASASASLVTAALKALR